MSAGEESFVPSAEPKLKNDSAYKVALFTYNLSAEAMELVAKVRDQQGATRNAKVALPGRTPTGPEGSTKLLFNFTPTGLAFGRYTLEFAVKQKGAAAGLVVSMPFVLK